jgi:glyoxylase I family protein
MANNQDHIKLKLVGMTPLFQVFDMPASIRFYRDVLGFEIISTSAPYSVAEDVDWALLRYNEIEVMLNTAYEKEKRPSVPVLTRITSHSDTCLYFGCPEIDKMYDHLAGQGIMLGKPIITGYQFKAIYIKDPDGFELCFHWPLDDRWDKYQ